jgi:hypothetical protein
MYSFSDLKFSKHPFFTDGKSARFSFPNKFGVSVITGGDAYCTKDSYEVGILYRDQLVTPRNLPKFLDEEVIGYQSEEHITELMNQLASLESL